MLSSKYQLANNGAVTPDDDKNAIKTLEGLTGLALKVFERILDKVDGSRNRGMLIVCNGCM